MGASLSLKLLHGIEEEKRSVSPKKSKIVTNNNKEVDFLNMKKTQPNGNFAQNLRSVPGNREVSEAEKLNVLKELLNREHIKNQFLPRNFGSFTSSLPPSLQLRNEEKLDQGLPSFDKQQEPYRKLKMKGIDFSKNYRKMSVEFVNPKPHIRNDDIEITRKAHPFIKIGRNSSIENTKISPINHTHSSRIERQSPV